MFHMYVELMKHIDETHLPLCPKLYCIAVTEILVISKSGEGNLNVNDWLNMGLSVRLTTSLFFVLMALF